MGKLCQGFGTRLAAFSFFFTVGSVLLATDLAPPRDVVISEISYNPPPELGSDDLYEFVELHNRGAGPVDVSSWILQDSGESELFIIPQGTVIAGAGHLVLARDRDALAAAYGAAIAVVGNVPFALSNGGDVVRLFDATGQLVDRVEYDDDAPWPDGADGSGSTLERVSVADDITDFTNFASSVEATRAGTPGAVNSRAGEIPLRHNVVINEIQYNPVKDPDAERLQHCPQEEFIEINNRGDVAIDVSSWQFADGITYTFPPGTVLEPNAYLVVYADGTSFEEKYGAVAGAVGPYERELDNGGEVLLLVDAEQRPVDFVDYNDAIPWPIHPDGLRGSLELASAQSDNDRGQAWRESASFLGTPGARNSAAEAFEAALGNSGPQITGVRAHPVADPSREVFVSTDSVRVEARVVDRNGVATVFLEVQTMAPGEYIRRTDPAFETTWTPLAMGYDTPSGKYIATIPPFPHRTLVRYRVVATDGAAQPATAQSPFARDPEPNYAYFVYDGVPDYVASQQSAFGAPGFVHRDLNKVPVYLIVGHPDDIEDVQFNTIPESQYSLYRHRVTFVHEGRVFDHVGVRLRGSITSRYSNPKRSWKIKFNKGNRFRGRFNDDSPFPNGRSKINIVRASDNGLIESLALKLYRDCQTLASTTTFVHLRIVRSADEHAQFDGDFFGLYLDLQAVDKVLMQDTDRPTDENASIYKYRGFPDKKHSDCDPEDRRDLESFMNPVLSGEATREFLFENMDVPRFLSFHVATDLAENHDMDGKNYYRYFNTDSGKWEIIPWDVDGTFRQTTGEEPLFRYLRLFPQEYSNRYRFLWQVVYDQERIGAILEDWRVLIQEIADANSDRWGSRAVGGTVTSLKDFIREQKALLVRQFSDDNIPFTPINTLPYESSKVTVPVELQTAPFGDLDAGETHAASRWLLIERGGDWAAPLWDLTSTTQLEETTVPADLLEVGKTYLFRAEHADSTGKVSLLSRATSFEVVGSRGPRPAAPAALEAEHVGFRSVVLKWTATSEAAEILGYVVLRDGMDLTAAPQAPGRFADTTVSPGAAYTYTVVAVSPTSLRSAPSTELSVEIPARVELGDWTLPAAGLDYLFDAHPGDDASSDPILERRGRYLDGSWVPSILNRWDGSRPGGEGSPGGIAIRSIEGAAEDGGPASVLSLEDPTSPSADTTFNNSRLHFLRYLGEENFIDDGITVLARARVNPAPADLEGPRAQEPERSRAQLGIATRGPNGRGHFWFWFFDDKLNTSTGQSVEVPMTEFVSIWLTLKEEEDQQRLRLFLNSATSPAVDTLVSLSNSGTEDLGGTYLEMGLPNTDAGGAIDVDYYGFARGVHAPGVEQTETFVRGDVNIDRTVTLEDGMELLTFLFLGGAAPACLDAADANDSGRLDVSDAVRIISHLVFEHERLGPPFPDCGQDESSDALGSCESACP